jgi:hypothetical protein
MIKRSYFSLLFDTPSPTITSRYDQLFALNNHLFPSGKNFKEVDYIYQIYKENGFGFTNIMLILK